MVRDVLGSSFLSRAYHAHLAPFRRRHEDLLARPFADRGQALAAEVMDALHLATGGIPALVTYGLQHLWRHKRALAERDVADVFAGFRRGHGEYLRDLLRSVADPKTVRGAAAHPGRDPSGGCSPAAGPAREHPPARWRPSRPRLDRRPPPARGGRSRSDRRLAPLRRSVEGFARHELARSADPVVPGRRPRRASAWRLRELAREASPRERRFFRIGHGEGKQLVPESVFAAHLALGFELLGWRTEREAQSAAGRTDLKLTRNGSPETVLIEVKIWGRNDYREAQRQIERYWTESEPA